MKNKPIALSWCWRRFIEDMGVAACPLWARSAGL